MRVRLPCQYLSRSASLYSLPVSERGSLSSKSTELVDGVQCRRPTLGKTTTVQIDLEPGAERRFIGYLAGSVVEIAVVRDASTETVVA